MGSGKGSDTPKPRTTTVCWAGGSMPSTSSFLLCFVAIGVALRPACGNHWNRYAAGVAPPLVGILPPPLCTIRWPSPATQRYKRTLVCVRRGGGQQEGRGGSGSQLVGEHVVHAVDQQRGRQLVRHSGHVPDPIVRGIFVVRIVRRQRERSRCKAALEVIMRKVDGIAEGRV